MTSPTTVAGGIRDSRCGRLAVHGRAEALPLRVSRPVVSALLLAGFIAGACPVTAAAQGWAVDLSAGRTIYNPVLLDVGTNNLTGTVRYDAANDLWVYGSAAAPLGGQAPFWTAGGVGGRVASSGGRTTVGLELAAQGFQFRDAVLQRTGTGGDLKAIPFVGIVAGAMRVEAHGGWRGETLSYNGTRDNRGVLDMGGRVTWSGAVRLQGDARWVRAAEGTFPFVGGSLTYAGSPVSAWVQAGRWVSTSLDAATWGGGLGATAGPRTSVWASVQQEAPDPLYWNAPRRTWSAGVTRRFGGPARTAPPATVAAASTRNTGGVTIRLPGEDAPGSALSIAGSFNDWAPIPMTRERRAWVIRLPLAPGVYQYAFRKGTGEWFVPASVPGRRDDGMGGSVATLVVQ